MAVQGYPDGQFATFFPLYPLTVRAAALLAGHNYELASIALSTIFFLAAAALLYHLVELDFGRRAALCSVAFLSLFPTSFFFQAAYSESLLLLLSLLCFWCLRRDRLVLAGVAALLATLTRVTGILLLAPLAMAYFGSSKRAAGRTGARPAALLAAAPRAARLLSLPLARRRRPGGLVDPGERVGPATGLAGRHRLACDAGRRLCRALHRDRPTRRRCCRPIRARSCRSCSTRSRWST